MSMWSRVNSLTYVNDPACQDMVISASRIARSLGSPATHIYRMLKKAGVLTRPTLARRDAPCPRRGRRVRASLNGVAGMIPTAPM